MLLQRHQCSAAQLRAFVRLASGSAAGLVFRAKGQQDFLAATLDSEKKVKGFCRGLRGDLSNSAGGQPGGHAGRPAVDPCGGPGLLREPCRSPRTRRGRPRCPVVHWSLVHWSAERLQHDPGEAGPVEVLVDGQLVLSLPVPSPGNSLQSLGCRKAS